MLSIKGAVNHPNVVTIAKKHVSALPLLAHKGRELQASEFIQG